MPTRITHRAGYFTILVLIAAFAFAGRQFLSRFLSNLDSLSTTIAYTALT